MTTSKNNFNISNLVEEVHSALSYAAAQKGLRFTFSVSHKVPRHLCGDLKSIRQALLVITQMAIEDSLNGSVEINVDLQPTQSNLISVKFSVHESAEISYWFSADLEAVKSKKIA